MRKWIKIIDDRAFRLFLRVLYAFAVIAFEFYRKDDDKQK